MRTHPIGQPCGELPPFPASSGNRKMHNKASQPMSHKRLGGGTGSPQRGLLGRCRFWEGSWLDFIGGVFLSQFIQLAICTAQIILKLGDALHLRGDDFLRLFVTKRSFVFL